MSDSIRVFVVDDEQPVLEGVKTVLENQSEGFILAGTALNGRHALEQIRSLQPDIILMDINMPGLSGIEVMRELRTQGVDSVCILVTAYERFDIAREAFGLGIFSYLLKPVTPSRLMEVLGDARREVDFNRERKSAQVETRSELDRRGRMLEQGFVSLLVSVRISPGVLEQSAAELGFSPHADWTLLCIQSGDAEAGEAFLRQLGYSHRFYRSMLISNRVFLLFFGQVEKDLLNQSLQRSLRKISDRFPGYQPRSAQTVIRGLASVYDAARALSAGELAPVLLDLPVRSAAGAAGGSLSGSSDGDGSPEARSDGAAVAGMELVNFMERRLIAGDSAGVFVRLQELYDLEEWTAGDFHAGCLRFLSLLYAREEDAVINQWLERESGPVEMDRPGVEFWLSGELERLEELYRRKLDTNPLIREALLFVDGNYHRSFGLEDAAEYCGVSAQHLSKSFSQHMGISFVDYLTQVRIQNALILFRKGNGSIREVAEACGYPDPNYFSRIFKKIHGLTPSQHLQRLQEEGSR